jgi:ring-1,2-phenylacetyl-CoA epoxidase subunit PaaE
MTTPPDTSVLSPAPARAARRHATFHPLRVAAVDPLTDDAVAITFAVPPELREEFAFLPGQHVTIRWSLDGSDVRRNYSICSSADGGPLRIAVKRLPEGVFSTYATRDLRPGDVLDVMTPTGRFSTDVDPARSRHYAAIAAGSGITPIISLLSTVLAVEQGSSCTLLYGNRTTASIMFLDELADLKDRYPDRFAVAHVLSGEPQEAELLSGRIDGARMRRFLDTLLPVDTVDEWFLCGPFAMVTELRGVLLDAGAERDHVHLELFHVGDEPGRPGVPARPRPARGGLDQAGGGPVSKVTVMLDGRATSFDLPQGGERVLDATLRVRPDAPYACKGGVCGTCRAKVVTGSVRMERNYALEDSELAAGVVLACQSHPTSDAVTLDFDI